MYLDCFGGDDIMLVSRPVDMHHKTAAQHYDSRGAENGPDT
jgi:hypothetical protein